MSDEQQGIPEGYSTSDYVLYKLDRTLAIAGIIAIAITAIFVYGGPDGVQIATGAVGGLVGYVGGRASK